MSPSKKTATPRRPRTHTAERHGSRARSAREEDLIALLAHVTKHERRVADALVTVLKLGDPRVLAALGVLVDFAVKQAAKGSR